MDDIEKLRETKRQLNSACEASDSALKDFCSKHTNGMGLVTDEARSTDTYKELRAQFDKDFQALRSFNAKYARFLRKAGA